MKYYLYTKPNLKMLIFLNCCFIPQKSIDCLFLVSKVQVSKSGIKCMILFSTLEVFICSSTEVLPDLLLTSSCVWSWGHCCGKSHPCPQDTSSVTLQTQMVGVS